MGRQQEGGAGTPVEMVEPGYDGAARRVSLSGLAVIALVAAALSFASDVFLPLALAMLLTFAISPLVTRLRRRGWPQMLAVLSVASAAFLMIGLFFLVATWQLGQLARGMPLFQANIVTKLENLRAAADESGIVARFSRLLATVNDQIGAAVEPEPQDPPAPARPRMAPLPVEVVNDKSPLRELQAMVVPLITPVATTGLVIVVVIFMLLERDEIRDRFIRLVGSNDLHRTTQVLEEAGSRVARYLQVQLLVNVIYAVPIGVGLWLIGVPNAPLWGLLTLVLRFVPYIGSVLAAAFPLLLAFAVSPDWSAVLWTAGLFLTVEVITSNVIEPWLYGAGTGLSPLAIIVAAIFWTWIWGPLGLVLSTPLTVCLVVLGRHLPQFELFDILFGDTPALVPHARLYHRLLSGDAMEATFRAAEALETVSLAAYYRDVALPALLIGQDDRARGVLTAEQEDRLTRTAMAMVAELDEVAMDEVAALRDAAPAASDPGGALIGNDRLDGEGVRILCFGGDSHLDDASAAMLAQALRTEAAEAAARPHADLAPSRFRRIDATACDCVILSFLNPSPSRASLLHVARIKRALPGLRVGVVIWAMPPDTAAGAQGTLAIPVDADKIAAAQQIGADFAVTGMEAAFRGAFSRAAPKPVAAARRRGLGRAPGAAFG